MNEKRKIIMLIGVPGTGKTTWCDYMIANVHKNAIVLSRDSIVESLCTRDNITYNESFFRKDLQKEVDELFRTALTNAKASTCDVIIDRTNLSVKTRKSILNSFSSDDKKIAVVFTLSYYLITQNLKTREQATGKHISTKLLEEMLARYEPPTYTEFDEIYTTETYNA